MNGLTRWTPRLIIATAVLHFGYVIASANSWSTMAGEGLFNTVANQSAIDAAERHGDLWFLIGGCTMLALGTLARRAVRDTGRIPVQIALYLLAIGVLVTIVEPVSGGALVIVLGFLVLASTRNLPSPQVNHAGAR